MISETNVTGSDTGVAEATSVAAVADTMDSDQPTAASVAAITVSPADACAAVIKTDQTITVATHVPSSAGYGTTFSVEATASSGLGVAITTSGTCTGSGTGLATITDDEQHRDLHRPLQSGREQQLQRGLRKSLKAQQERRQPPR